MKNTASTPRLIVSAAAATRFYLMIASMSVADHVKGSLMIKLSEVIEGRRDISDADFGIAGEPGEELRALLSKAITRSARARAAAARRREALEKPAEEKPEVEATASVEPTPSEVRTTTFKRDKNSAARLLNRRRRKKRRRQ